MSTIANIAGMLMDPARSCIPVEEPGRGECYREPPPLRPTSSSSTSEPVNGVESLLNLGRALQDMAIGLADLLAGKSQK